MCWGAFVYNNTKLSRRKFKLLRQRESDGSTLPCINRLSHCWSSHHGLQKAQKTKKKFRRFEDTFATLRTSTSAQKCKQKQSIVSDLISHHDPHPLMMSARRSTRQAQKDVVVVCRRTPGLPINRHFIVADPICHYSPEKQKADKNSEKWSSTRSHSSRPLRSLITQCPCCRHPHRRYHQRSTCGSPRWLSRQPPEWCPS